MSPRTVRSSALNHPLPQVEHAWITESSHHTSVGTIHYVRCQGCGARRVDLQSPDNIVPRRLSREIATADDHDGNDHDGRHHNGHDQDRARSAMINSDSEQASWSAGA